jgi:hypothetical protein
MPSSGSRARRARVADVSADPYSLRGNPEELERQNALSLELKRRAATALTSRDLDGRIAQAEADARARADERVQSLPELYEERELVVEAESAARADALVALEDATATYLTYRSKADIAIGEFANVLASSASARESYVMSWARAHKLAPADVPTRLEPARFDTNRLLHSMGAEI